MNENNRVKRDIGLDFTRIFAFFSVVSVHFFLNTDFYKRPINGVKMQMLVGARTFFMVCVPLFLLLTGYLQGGKKIDLTKRGIVSYYKKLRPILIRYILSMLLVYLFLILAHREDFSIKNTLYGTLGFKHYAWYVNMYIGLFLLTPFLNIIWNEIEGKSVHLILVLVFASLTILPSIVNIYDLNSFAGIFAKFDGKKIVHLIPDWWINLFPITYYFIGAYINKYVRIKSLDTSKILTLLVGSVILSGIYNVFRSHGGNFVSRYWNSWGSFENTLNAVLVFLLINKLSPSRVGISFGKVVGKISSLTFSAYLISAVTDKFVYAYLNSLRPSIIYSYKYYPIVVTVSALTSLILAGFLEIIAKYIDRKYPSKKVEIY